MANISKTTRAVLALQSVAASSVLISAPPIDVSSLFGGALFINFGRRAATAAGAGVKIRVEASSEVVGDGYWNPLTVLETDFAAAEPEPVTGTNSSGQKVITMASTLNLAVGDVIFIDNTANILNSEWGRIKSLVANTSVTLEDNLLNSQAAGSATIYNKAEIYPPVQLDLTPYLRLRLVVDGSKFTQAFAVRASLSTGDSIG